MHFRSQRVKILQNSSLEHHTSRIIQYTHIIHMNLRSYKILRMIMIVFVKKKISKVKQIHCPSKDKKKRNAIKKYEEKSFFHSCLYFFHFVFTLQTFIHLKMYFFVLIVYIIINKSLKTNHDQAFKILFDGIV